MDNLESGYSLSRTCRHYYQNPVLAFGNSLYSTFDCYSLIISRIVGIWIRIERLLYNLQSFTTQLLGINQAFI